MSACQSLAGSDVSATLSSDLTAYAVEAISIQGTAQMEQVHFIETLEPASTIIADVSNINQILAATVARNVVPTQSVHQAIVSFSPGGYWEEREQTEGCLWWCDELSSHVMVSSLTGTPSSGTSTSDTMSMDAQDSELASVNMLEVINLATAGTVRSQDGCASGIVTQFSTENQQIYVTAQVLNLAVGTSFSVDWNYEQRLVYRSAWTSDYSAASECIWFYMEPADAPFLPGNYSITMYVNGSQLPSQSFSINTG